MLIIDHEEGQPCPYCGGLRVAPHVFVAPDPESRIGMVIALLELVDIEAQLERTALTARQMATLTAAQREHMRNGRRIWIAARALKEAAKVIPRGGAS